MSSGERGSRKNFATRTFFIAFASSQSRIDGTRSGDQPDRTNRAKDGPVCRRPIGKDAVGVGGP
jgi:hypothetical protein